MGLYRPLVSPRAIRVLRIEPATADAVISCTLQEHNLDDCPKYEALSYVWGTTDNPDNLICDGERVSVTQNLGRVLRRLRQPDHARVIWVDALCIDQGNLAERSAQVSMMRDVYISADRVVVWLGEDDDNQAEAAKTLVRAIAHVCQSGPATIEKPWAEMTPEERVMCCDMHDLTNLNDPSDALVQAHWQALADLFLRSYWSRAWCVQEIASAKSSTIIFGGTQLPWNEIGLVAGWLQGQSNKHDFKLPPLLDYVDTDSIERVEVMQSFSDPDMKHDTILDALRLHREFNATDLRDKVYAILGLVPYDPLTQAIRVDYNQSLVQAYTQVAVAAIDTYNDLSILCYVQHPHEFSNESPFPSWVARWDASVSQAIPIRMSHLPEFDWATNGARTLQSYTFKSPTTLRLRGFAFDTVSSPSSPMSYRQFNLSDPISDSSPVLSLLDTVFAHKQSIDLSNPNTYDDVLSFAKTLTLEMDLEWFGAVFDMDEDRYFNDFCAYIRELHQRTHAHIPTEGSDRVAVSAPPSPIVTALIQRAAAAASTLQGDWRRYETAASRMCDDRRFFQTADLELTGLGPAAMREGDVLVVLDGGRVPFVLRRGSIEEGMHAQVQEYEQSDIEGQGQDGDGEGTARGDQSNEWYHFIGEAYVAHAMRGAIVENRESGEYEERVFELR